MTSYCSCDWKWPEEFYSLNDHKSYRTHSRLHPSHLIRGPGDPLIAFLEVVSGRIKLPSVVTCAIKLIYIQLHRTSKWKVKVLVAQSCLTLCNPMDCSLPGSSVHGILQARVLEWVAIPFSTGSSQYRDQTRVSCTAGRFFTIWAAREALSHFLNCTLAWRLIWYPCRWNAECPAVSCLLTLIEKSTEDK